MDAIVFDLDGTLIDSAADIHAACSLMLADEGRDPLPFEVVKSFIGNGVPALVDHVMTAVGQAGRQTHSRLTAAFLAHYDAAPARLTRVYPGVRDTLTALSGRGFALGVCTNKPLGPTVLILEALELSDYFDAVVGGDSLPVRKPDPAVLAHVFALMGAERRLYVGDSEVDAQTALNAGVTFALFTEGYRRTPVADLPHAHAFADFAALPAIAAEFFAVPA